MTALEIKEADCAAAGGKRSFAESDVRLGGDSSKTTCYLKPYFERSRV